VHKKKQKKCEKHTERTQIKHSCTIFSMSFISYNRFIRRIIHVYNLYLTRVLHISLPISFIASMNHVLLITRRRCDSKQWQYWIILTTFIRSLVWTRCITEITTTYHMNRSLNKFNDSIKATNNGTVWLHNKCISQWLHNNYISRHWGSLLKLFYFENKTSQRKQNLWQWTGTD
jgi:hypothetical protein